MTISGRWGTGRPRARFIFISQGSRLVNEKLSKQNEISKKLLNTLEISKIRKMNFQKSGLSNLRCPIRSSNAAINEEILVLKIHLGQGIACLADLKILRDFAHGIHPKLPADLDDPAGFFIGK